MKKSAELTRRPEPKAGSGGEGIKVHGVEDHGVEIPVGELYDEFAKTVPAYEWNGRKYPSLADPVSAADAVLFQVGTGMIIAIFDRWGSLWYLRTAVPWFWSLAKLQPDISAIVRLPGLVKLHFVFGFAVLLLFPFTRLVHIVMLPLQYLWRSYQVVIWNRRENHQPSGEA